MVKDEFDKMQKELKKFKKEIAIDTYVMFVVTICFVGFCTHLVITEISKLQ